MKKILLIFLIFTALTVLLLPGCQLGKISRTTASSTQSWSEGGVIRLSDVDPTTLDPAVYTESTSAQFIMQIYSGLLKLGSNLEPVADIAESWSIDDTGTIYTFKLRQDVKFQNGQAVKASDFKYSWERAADPLTGSQTAETYLGDISGVKEMLSGKAGSIAGVTVIDDYTLEVKIDSPKSYFLYKLSYPAAFVLNKNSVSRGSSWWRSSNNGTGPFKLDQWIEGQSLRLLRNELYYGQKPALAAVQYSFYSGLPMDLYETNKIDVTAVSTSYIDSVMDPAGPFYKDLKISSDLSLLYLGFNCRQAPFDDVNIRKSFSLAVDKDKLIHLISRDMQKRADGILPPGMPGYNPEVVGLKHDPASARALIQASKYGSSANLPAITLTTSGYGGGIGQWLQALVYQWRENLGVEVKVRQLETERYFYNTSAEIDQMYMIGWSADYPHPQDFVDILFHSNTHYNYGGYASKEVDALIERANAAADENTGFALYQQAEQAVVNDAPVVPLSFGMNYYLVKSHVENYRLDPLGLPTLKEVSIKAY